jgi:ABC-type nickel/cobalt efflux system permease component RcnA
LTGNDLSFVVAVAVIAISVGIAMTASVAVAGVLIEEALYAAIAWESTGSYEGSCCTVSISIILTGTVQCVN